MSEQCELLKVFQMNNKNSVHQSGLNVLRKSVFNQECFFNNVKPRKIMTVIVIMIAKEVDLFVGMVKVYSIDSLSQANIISQPALHHEFNG